MKYCGLLLEKKSYVRNILKISYEKEQKFVVNLNLFYHQKLHVKNCGLLCVWLTLVSQLTRLIKSLKIRISVRFLADLLSGSLTIDWCGKMWFTLLILWNIVVYLIGYRCFTQYFTLCKFKNILENSQLQMHYVPKCILYY